MKHGDVPVRHVELPEGKRNISFLTQLPNLWLQDQKFQAVFCVGEFSAEEMDLEVCLVFTCLHHLHRPFKTSATIGNPGNDCGEYVVSI